MQQYTINVTVLWFYPTQEKLQDERKKEYNMFLRGKEGAQEIGKTSTTPQV